MLNKFLTDEKTFRIFILILFAILFFIVLKKNKKEKFTQLSTENLEAINNLSTLTKQILDTPNGTLDLDKTELKIKSLQFGSITNLETYLKNINNNITTFNTTLNETVTKVDNIIKKLKDSECLAATL